MDRRPSESLEKARESTRQKSDQKRTEHSRLLCSFRSQRKSEGYSATPSLGLLIPELIVRTFGAKLDDIDLNASRLNLIVSFPLPLVLIRRLYDSKAETGDSRSDFGRVEQKGEEGKDTDSDTVLSSRMARELRVEFTPL